MKLQTNLPVKICHFKVYRVMHLPCIIAQISVLQAIVEKECEERERLTKELSLAKASSKRSKKTH